MELEAASGRSVLAVLVFAHALRYFKDCCIKELNEQSTSATAITTDDIQWVITVPAIWRQSAKQFMRHAATEVKTRPTALKQSEMSNWCMLVVSIVYFLPFSTVEVSLLPESISQGNRVIYIYKVCCCTNSPFTPASLCTHCPSPILHTSLL